MSQTVDEKTGEVTEIVPSYEWPAGVHPAADLFPMIAPAEFVKLVADIDAHGQRDPIYLDAEGRLLDGRNRLAACQHLGIEPKTRTYEGAAATDLAISLNVHRRHLTQAQLAAVAVDALPLYEEEAAARQRSGTSASAEAKGKASEIAAESVGVGHASVERLKRVKTASEETFEQVRNGEKSIREAEREVTPAFKPSVMRQLEDAKKANPPPAADDRSPAAAAARVAKAKEMAAKGFTSRQIAPELGISLANFSSFKARHGVAVPADKVTRNSHHHDSNRIVSETVSTLEGLVMGVGLADVSDLDPDQINGWVDSFTDSIKALTKFRNQMKEHNTHE